MTWKRNSIYRMRTSRKPWFTRWLWTVLCHSIVESLGRRSEIAGFWGRVNMLSRQQAANLVVVMVLAGVVLAAAETRKDYHFKVGKHATISILNQYGPVSVKAGARKQVIVTAILHSDKVEVDQDQRGSRVTLLSHLLPGADETTGVVEYQVLVPADASVTLHSTTGPLHVEKLHGDVILEGNTARVDVRD